MMSIIIQGPKQPGNDIDVYLRPLVEDLKLLWKKEGVCHTPKFSSQAKIVIYKRPQENAGEIRRKP